MSDTPLPFDPLRSTLAKLVPEDGRITITTADGTPVTLRTVLPARRQVAVARIVEKLFRRTIATGTVDAIRAGSGSGVASQILAGLHDDEALEAVGLAFSTAYPYACQNGADPLDVYPIEEVVAAILPLLVRPILRGLDVVGPLASGTTPES